MQPLLNVINQDAIRAERIMTMIENIKAKRKPRGIHIHEYKSNQ